MKTTRLVIRSSICFIFRVVFYAQHCQPHALRSTLAYNRERVGRNTRQSDNLSMPRVKNNHGKRRFMYRTVKKNEFVITPGLAKLSRRPFKAKIKDAIRRS